MELVIDEYGNTYLKQFIGNYPAFYIPFPFETSEQTPDSLKYSYANRIQ
jgi:hypothetical protein